MSNKTIIEQQAPGPSLNGEPSSEGSRSRGLLPNSRETSNCQETAAPDAKVAERLQEPLTSNLLAELRADIGDGALVLLVGDGHRYDPLRLKAAAEIERLTAELQGTKDELYSVDKAAKELGAELAAWRRRFPTMQYSTARGAIQHEERRAADETTPVQSTPPMYSTSYCEKHKGQPWSYTITAFTSSSAVMPRIVCPLCFPPDSK